MATIANRQSGAVPTDAHFDINGKRNDNVQQNSLCAELYGLFERFQAEPDGFLPITDLVESRAHPLLWGQPVDAERSEFDGIAKACRTASPRGNGANAVCDRIHFWLNYRNGISEGIQWPLQALLWAHHFPWLAVALPQQAREQLATRLAELCCLTKEIEGDDWRLRNLWLHGELPVVLARWALDPKVTAACLRLSHATLSRGLTDYLDGRGFPHADLWVSLRPMLASWIRCRIMCDSLGVPAWNGDAEEQFQHLLAQVFRLTRADGAPVFSESSAEFRDADLISALLDLSDDPANQDIAHAVLSGKTAKKKTLKTLPGYESEWAEGAILWSSWSSASPRFAVAYANGQVRGELSSKREVLWTGAMPVQVIVDGQQHQAPSEWTQVCWQSDSDIDYLEVEADLELGMRMQRQFLLCRQDEVLFIGDAVLGNAAPHEFQYELILPLAENCEFLAERETTEGTLSCDGRGFRILPLSIPEWRASSPEGRLSAMAKNLAYRVTGRGKNHYAALVVDLSSARASKAMTWRQLTVAEQRAEVSDDTAVGYRVQLGKQQWLIYRSLGDPASRTVLGHNLITEFLFGRFLPNGTVEPLLEIE